MRKCAPYAVIPNLILSETTTNNEIEVSSPPANLGTVLSLTMHYSHPSRKFLQAIRLYPEHVFTATHASASFWCRLTRRRKPCRFLFIDQKPPLW